MEKHKYNLTNCKEMIHGNKIDFYTFFQIISNITIYSHLDVIHSTVLQKKKPPALTCPAVQIRGVHTCAFPHHRIHPTRYTRLTGALYRQMFIQLIWGQTAWTLRQEHSFTHPSGAFDGDISPFSAFIIDMSLSSLWTVHLLLNKLGRCTVAGCIRDDLELRSYLHNRVFWSTYAGTKVNVVLICWAFFTDKYSL